MWNGLINTAGQGSGAALSGLSPGGRGTPCVATQGRHQLQNKRHQPRSLSLSLFHMKVCKKQIGK